MKQLCIRMIRETDGQDLIEYAMLAGALALFCLATIQSLGLAINNALNTYTTVLAS